MNKNQSTGIIIIVAIILIALLSVAFEGPATSTSEISYTQFLNKVQLGSIEKVQISKDTLIATPTETTNNTSTEEKTPIKQPKTQFRVQIPQGDETLYSLLKEKNVEIQVAKPQDGSWMSMVGSVIIPIIFIAIMIILILKGIQQTGSSALNFGKSKAKLLQDDKIKITFKDVAGIDEERQELEEIVDFLKNSEKYTKLGAKIPKGVLLVGAPGTGKTLMAKAVAGEAGVPFFSISGSDFVEMFVGVGASRVRDLFEQAKKNQPCMIFIDEIDAVGRQRGAGMGGGHDEREQTLNQLLVEMDGFDESTNIIVIAATNRPDILDSALLRPGRFDRQIYVNEPDVKGREEILNVHAKNKKLAADVDLKALAKRVPGFTGADLKNLLNEAALLAARNNGESITMGDIDKSIDRVIAGIEKKSTVLTQEDKERTSYHEAGHAVILKMLEDCEEVQKISIIPRGRALGLTWYTPKDDSKHQTKRKLLAHITDLLGGRVAEELVYGDNISTGASNDMQRATKLARNMVTQWGMSEKMGNMTYGQPNEHVFMGRDFGQTKDYSEQVAYELDKEIKRIIDEKYELARQILIENRDILNELAMSLLENESINAEEFDEIVEKVKQRRQNS
ncbi:MAG: ATP-dependent metallopeptidase FtsH/Yme1/Tma family protein [Cyanobacteria bacterium SIG27]|nr:ATP-dependent metallopeptidase FtsH/Yme1/Tma family protein [Cyanobacteria bacterium SIG27]